MSSLVARSAIFWASSADVCIRSYRRSLHTLSMGFCIARRGLDRRSQAPYFTAVSRKEGGIWGRIGRISSTGMITLSQYKLIEAADDEQAVEIAKRYVDGHDVEVWDGDRKVSRLSSIE